MWEIVSLSVPAQPDPTGRAAAVLHDALTPLEWGLMFATAALGVGLVRGWRAAREAAFALVPMLLVPVREIVAELASGSYLQDVYGQDGAVMRLALILARVAVGLLVLMALIRSQAPNGRVGTPLAAGPCGRRAGGGGSLFDAALSGVPSRGRRTRSSGC
ncbi:MAG: hypothetical protein ACRDQF_03690 [Thermocrispum sp.]